MTDRITKHRTSSRSSLIRRCVANLMRATSTLKVAVKRLLAQPGLMLATLLGLVMVAALVMSIPMYAEGVYYRVLSEGLFSDAPSFRGKVVRPPVAVLYRYVGAFTGPLQWDDVAPLDRFFQDDVYEHLHLPASPDASSVHMFNTGLFGFFPERDADVLATKPPELEVALAAFGTPEAHLRLLDGILPGDAAPSTDPDASIDVLISRAIAEKMGIQTGEMLIAYDRRALRRYEANPARFILRVVGVWEPASPNAEYWDYVQVPPDNTLIVSAATFSDRLGPALTDEIYQALWYLPMDASRIYVSDVDLLLARLNTLDHAVQMILPSTTVDVSPVKALRTYQASAGLLDVLLLASSVPVVGLLLAFVALIVTLNTERQRNQIAVMRSRGASSGQIAGIAMMESLVLGALALCLALPVSLLLARMMGQTRTFLDFSLQTDFRVGITWPTVLRGAVAMGLSLVAQVVPTLGAARYTTVSYKQERARTLRPPWWQRAWLDGLLLIPGGYGAYLLSVQGSLLGVAEGVPADPFSNPLLFLVPALTLLGLTLLLLRLLPLVLRLVAWITGHSGSVSLLMASRQLARAPGLYAAPLGLLVLTLALSSYTASLAATMDNHLFDQQFYRVGADVSLADTGEDLGAADIAIPTGGSNGTNTDAAAGAMWQFLPVLDYLNLPGVTGATRVGRYAARVQTPGGFVPGAFIGVDRADFSRVAYWRGDFASEPLGSLMNQLATAPDGVLLPRAFMHEQFLTIGDRVTLAVQAYGQSAPVQGRIVGTFDYFPTWYPDSGPLVVGNLDYLFQSAQTEVPYRVWMRTAANTDYDHLGTAVRDMNLGAEALMVAGRSIASEQRRPEHQGLLGLLSVGFTAAAGLTALGFMLYGLSSFRRRSVELGVLRATGLSSRHVTGIIGWELAMLLVIGAGTGTGLGTWASRVFVPYLQIGVDATAQVPPYDVTIAWPALVRLYGLFGALFVVALTVLVRQIVRLKLFQAIKLGETV